MFAASICAWLSLGATSFIGGLLVQKTRASRHTNILCLNNDAEMHADILDLSKHDGCLDLGENVTRNKSIQFYVHSHTKKV